MNLKVYLHDRKQKVGIKSQYSNYSMCYNWDNISMKFIMSVFCPLSFMT